MNTSCRPVNRVGLEGLAMNRPLACAALVEAATGLALIVVPSLVARLLLGTELSGVGLAVGRVAGIGLMSLGLACWPNKVSMRSALRGMTTYGLTVAIYPAYLGFRGGSAGPLLWPAVALHAVLTLLLIRELLRSRRTSPFAGTAHSDEIRY